jgi:uncharacterized protein YpmS
MANGENEKYISWRFISVTIVGIIFIIVGAIISDTRANIVKAEKNIETLQKEKVDKEQYQCDIREIKDSLNFLVKREMRDRK